MAVHTALSEAIAAPRPTLEVADIFRTHGESYRNEHRLNSRQRKAMHDIEVCRTAVLGGHVAVCEHRCGYNRISYNSCRNRHCPKCQGVQSARWLAQRHAKILPTHYFHTVFTVPHELHPIILPNPKVLFNILFRAAAQSLLQLAKDWKHLRAEVGLTAILHTWNQDMLFHPHLHVVVTGGGLDPSHTEWIASRNNFLVPVRALSKKFACKFLDFLKSAFTRNELVFLGALKDPDAFQLLMNKLYRKKWVVYCKQPFGGAENIFRYLGLYTHKVAISNHRLTDLRAQGVTFSARDNQNPGRKRSVSVSAHEFIRRFLLHILPHRFVKIRHYGLMAPRNSKTKLEIAKRLLQQMPAHPSQEDSSCHDNPIPDIQPTTWMEVLLQITGIDLGTCPKCGSRLVRHPLTVLNKLPDHMKHGPMLLDSS